MSATISDTIVIRQAGDADAGALERLARLDGGRVPAGPVLVAEADGEIRAALSVATREFVADPFFPSRELVALLDMRAARMRRDTLPLAARIRDRVSLWSHLWWRASQLGPTQ